MFSVEASAATVPVISLASLIAEERKTLAQLAEAIQADGIFHLNFSNSTYAGSLHDRDRLYELAESVFASPQKSNHHIDRISPLKIDGWKPEALTPGISEGKRDGFEAYFVSQDALFTNTDDHQETSVQFLLDTRTKQQLARRFVADVHQVLALLLRLIARSLQVCEEDLANSHALQTPSPSSLGLLKYQPLIEESLHVGHGAHTDVGTLSVLFTTAPGLQVYSRHRDQWIYVDPRDDCAIVNVGDALRFLTEKRTTSCLHRVVPHQEPATREKLSLAYFLRPSYETSFVDEEGTRQTYLDFHSRKYQVFKASFVEQAKDSLLTSKAGFLGQWSGTNNHTAVA